MSKKKRKAGALALLSGYASGSGGSGSDGGASDASSPSASASDESEDLGPLLGPAGPPRREEDAAPAVEAGPSLGPSWRPADGDYEELPEAPSDEDGGEGGEHALGDDDAADDAGVADAPTRYVSVPPSLAHAPPLPPPPAEPCRAELQAKVQRFHALMLSGRSINAELRKSKGYRNPDFLTKIVEHFGIAEHGSGYPRDVFDPTALAPEDFYDAISAAQRRQAEVREAERSRRSAVDFAPGGVQPGTGVHAQLAPPGAAGAAGAPGALLASVPPRPMLQPRAPGVPVPLDTAAGAAAASAPPAGGGRRSRWDPPSAAPDGIAAAAAMAAAINARIRGNAPQ